MNTLFARIIDPTAGAPRTGTQPRIAAQPPTRVFVRDLMLEARVGIHAHELKAPQRLCVNLDMLVRDRAADGRDRLADVVCYEAAANRIAAIVAEGHVNLLETLAETIATALLADDRVESATIRLEKPDALAACASVGIEITRTRG